MNRHLPSNLLAVVAGWLLIAVHFLIFSQFFPNANGSMGNDYAYKFPLLLDGYYWFINNGIFSRPLFTPSFCGGIPRLANPQAVYVSVLQFLTFFTDPLSSIRLTFLLFATLGFWGFYLLLTRRFAIRPWTALLGGTLFLFNGFYAWRFVIGHAEFHSFMLVPLLAFFLLPPQPLGLPRNEAGCPDQEDGPTGPSQPPPVTAPDPLRRWRNGRGVVAGAMLMGYMLWGAMIQLFIPSLLSVVVIALVHRLAMATAGLRVFLSRFAGASLLALGLTASKLVATSAFLHNAPREGYLLPGVDSLPKLLGLVGEALVLGGGRIDSTTIVVNTPWLMQRHEFEYGVSVAPFIIIPIYLVTRLARRKSDQALGGGATPGRTAALGLCALLLALPIMLNYYSPAWNHFLKALPVFRQLSNIFRWFVIYIPFLILATAMAIERTKVLSRFQLPVVAMALALIVGQNLITDIEYYTDMVYYPDTILKAYDVTRESRLTPTIEYMVTSADETGNPQASLDGNDALVGGGSQLLCYEPMFGYQLENLPFKTIHPGPALEVEDEILNLKNPACYLYPEENRCEPGDHFLASQLQEADNFINFLPFDYEKSRLQEVADDITLAAFFLVMVLACLCCIVSLRATMRSRLPRELAPEPSPLPANHDEPPPPEP